MYDIDKKVKEIKIYSVGKHNVGRVNDYLKNGWQIKSIGKGDIILEKRK